MSDHAEGSREDERNATRPAARVIEMLARGRRRFQHGKRLARLANKSGTTAKPKTKSERLYEV